MLFFCTRRTWNFGLVQRRICCTGGGGGGGGGEGQEDDAAMQSPGKKMFGQKRSATKAPATNYRL